MKKLWRIVGFSVFLIVAVSFFQPPESHVVAQIPEYTPDGGNSEPAQTREKPFVVGQSTKRKAIVARSATNTAVAVIDVRNLDDQNWLERFELEVKNISGKPIYHLEIDLSFPDIVNTELDGVPRGLIIPLMYGRYELTRESNFATSDDKPIKPGENHIFTIPESDRSWLEIRLASGIVPESAVKRLGVRIDSLSFGDGTGFTSTVPFSFTKRSSSNKPAGGQLIFTVDN